MLDELRSDDFAQRLDQTFYLCAAPDERLEATLIDVSKVKSKSEGASSPSGREPFSVVFRLGDNTYLQQSIYRVEHEEMGALDLFLVPIGPDETGMRYEAVFT